MASSTEADLTQVIPLLVDGIAQEIGAERRDMRVTFVADHRQHDLSAWSELKYKLMEETKFVWQRPNALKHPRAYFEISLDNESLLMNRINTTSVSRKTSRAVKLIRNQESPPRFGKQVRMEVLCRL